MMRLAAVVIAAIILAGPALADAPSPDDLRAAYEAATAQRNRAMDQQIELVLGMRKMTQASQAKIEEIMMEWAVSSLAAYESTREPPK